VSYFDLKVEGYLMNEQRHDFAHHSGTATLAAVIYHDQPVCHLEVWNEEIGPVLSVFELR
jgi:hypothetical protein